MKKLCFIILLLLPISLFAQLREINGIVSDVENNRLPYINIFTADSKYQTITDEDGHFSIQMPKSYSQLYFRNADSNPMIVDLPEAEDNITITVKMSTENRIELVVVEADKINASGVISVDAKITEVLPSISGGIESLIKTELGVTGSRNELSSKYSVRGGSFDENLVYVNGIEIYRPQLIRSGQQEGLSFINPKMVSDVKFSSGGFEARYGGKMSSVLDITYKQVRKRELSTSISLLGASLHYQDITKNKKFSHVSGIRYKTTKYLLNTLETEGEYDPRFIDFQTFWTWYISSKFNINFLANVSDNNFRFNPESGETNFGSIQELYSLNIFFLGQESDRFFTNSESVSFNYFPHKNLNYSLDLSFFNAIESENFDIIGFYQLNELNRDVGSETAGDSILNLGNGAYMTHARNSLNIIGFTVQHRAYYKTKKHYLNWGILWRYEDIIDQIDEWNLKDSASYSIPVNTDLLTLDENIKSDNHIINNKFTAYLQDKYIFQSYLFQYEIIGGARVDYATISDEFLFSPRFAFAARSFNKNNHVIRFSSGIFNQPVFYKEMRTFTGELSDDKSAQKSIHFVIGHNFKFNALGRNFKLYTEVYYKILNNIIPFEMDNVRVRYFADTRTTGYAGGIDLKLAGDFVPGIDSWLSLSVLKTEEKVTLQTNGSNTGFYIPRPTDQRFTANLFVQDYLPGNSTFKAHLNFVYGTGFPFGFPKSISEKAIARSFNYQRVDLGASAVIIKEDKKYKSRFLKMFKSVWLTIEVFNMLDINNTISYRWIDVVPNTSVAANDVNNTFPVPNNLTGRRFNMKLSVKI
jgi:hypothetical protein